MAISGQKTTQLDSKLVEFIAYLGTPDENLSATLDDPDSACNIRFRYAGKLVTGEIEKTIEDSFVLSLARIEQDFPGIIAQLTEIADHYNRIK